MPFTCNGTGEYIDYRDGQRRSDGSGRTATCPGCTKCQPPARTNQQGGN